MTHPIQRRTVLQAAALSGLAGLGLPTWAQGSGWPTRPVSLVVPFPAGGGTDAFARPMAAQFSRLTGRLLELHPAHPEANIIFGAVVDPELDEELRITVVATGFDEVTVEARANIREFPVKTVSSNDIDIPAFLRRR